MAQKKAAISPEVKAALKGVTGPCARAMAQLAAEGRKVQVLGRVKNGKVEFNRDSLEAFARRYPNAAMSFIAVNAPFDPVQA